MNSRSSFHSVITAFTVFALAAGGLSAADEAAAPGATPVLPRLVDLGAGKCIPCKQMKPILEDLARNYATTFETVFIDVWEHREEGQRYGIRMIPTQIFLDASGRELFRHEGFMAKKDILAKWKELGVDVESAGAPATPAPASAPQG
jgi:thioredoxin 1